MEQAAPISVSGLSRAYGKNQVLDDISFELKQGEVFGLIGLNGAGKTTLIKIILGLLKAHGGDTSIFGVDCSRVASRQKLSYLPEKFVPSRYLKGHEYLSLSLSFYKKNYHPEEGRNMASMLDLDPEALDRLVGSYSKGMGQKLGLAGAFLIDAPLMILDEPMSGLDPKARILLKNEIRQAKQLGRTVFFSSHILADMDEICDRIAVLHDHKLVFVGKPAAFKSTYEGDSLEAVFLNAIEASQAA